ncbi:CapA family protein [Bacillus sp. FJAT-45350]|uniref:CapA family protein n=1 Tax=Bacillus sp. FJAT-45350 TaxID=2011014 RepID=UPI000BB6E967|nr:CapA family protein [Bacillus sp. FJAT-45350]
MKKLLFYQSITFAFIFSVLFIVFVFGSMEQTMFSKEKGQRVSTNHTFKHIADNVQTEDVGEQRRAAIIREPIRIVFAGDLMMSGSIVHTVETHGVDYPFHYVRDEIKEADYAVVNLETAVTTRGESFAYDKQFTFKMPPHYLEGIKNAGFDMVSLANNHTMDYREEGLIDTINYLKEYEIDYIGAGENKTEAYKAHFVDIKGKKVAFLGFSRVLPTGTWYAQENKPGIASGYQLDRMERIIKKTKKKADYVLVYIHWGIERQQTPEQYQVNKGKAMIDAGADAIIGAHPHVLQPIEEYKGKPIAYSLGNFLFPDYVSGPTAETGLLTLVLDGDEVGYEWREYVITNDQIHPVGE